MKKFCIAASLILAALTAPPPAAAQVTYTTPQTVKALVANNVACTGTAQNFTTAQGLPNFRNLGQTQHYVSVAFGTVTTGTVEIDGIDRNGNVFRISDVLSLPGSSTNGAVTGTGSFDNIQISVTCSAGGTFTLTYGGTSATSNVDAGAYLFAQTDKVIFAAVSANVNNQLTLQTPFGSSAGTISLKFAPSAPTGATLSVNCLNSQGIGAFSQAFLVTIPAVTTLQLFNVPAAACAQAQIFYAGTGGAGNTLNVEYLFNVPGALNNPPNNYTHITGTTATTVAPSQGFLHTLTVNLGAAGTISILDLAGGACTGTPASPLIAKITATATTLQTFTYDVQAFNGICVQASAAMDITVSAHAP